LFNGQKRPSVALPFRDLRVDENVLQLPALQDAVARTSRADDQVRGGRIVDAGREWKAVGCHIQVDAPAVPMHAGAFRQALWSAFLFVRYRLARDEVQARVFANRAATR